MKIRFKHILLTIIGIAFVGTFILLWRSSRPKKVEYETVTATVKDIRRTSLLTGKVVPRDEVAIKPQITGIISEICKEAGDMVQEGEVIAKVKVIPEMSSLSSAQSRVRLADINLTQAKTDLDREKALYDQNLVSADEYDKVRQTWEQAVEEKNAAVDALEVVRDGVSKANASSSSTLIRSTISGLILDIPVKVGTSVINSNTFNDGTTVATVADMGDLIFDGYVDETEVGQIAVGTPMSISIGAISGHSFDAVTEYISPKAKENNGTNEFEVKAAMAAPDSVTIRSGYSANAEIVMEQAIGVLTVPEMTLSYEDGGTYVYVKDGDGWVRTAVETGLSDGIDIEIRSGLAEGAEVRGNEKI